MDKDAYSLFGDTEPGAENGLKDKNSLKIVAGRSKPLSKNQRMFNKMTKRIEQLQNSIKTEAAKLEVLLKVFHREIPGKKKALAESRLMVAKALGNSAKTIKLTKRQYEQARDVILCLCDEAFSDIEPDAETESFYDAWSESSYREELQGQSDLAKRMIAEEARHLFGMKIDPDEIDDSPEGFARFARRMQEELAAREGAAQGAHAFSRKKTKKQQERDELRKQDEALTLKSMRSIYLSLAKALHPDTVMDPAEKAHKEELMKKVTAAYAEKDLTTLLKLEMEWVASESAALDTLPDDKLKLYISSLKEQVDALEQEHDALYHHPRFTGLSEFARYPEATARQLIAQQAREYERAAKALSEIEAILARTVSKKEIMAFVKEYGEIMNTRDSFPEEFMGDIF